MCFFTLFCIVSAVKNNIFRSSYILFTSCASIIGLVFITLLTGFLLFKAKEFSRHLPYYLLFLLNLFFMIFFFALAHNYFQLQNHVLLITVLVTIDYFLSMSIFLTLWLYQKQFLENSFITRVANILIFITFTFYTAVLVINLFHPILFLITEDGEFSPDVADNISITVDFIFLLLLSIPTLASKQSLTRKFCYISCFFSPLLFTMLTANQDVLKWTLLLWGIIICTFVLPLCLLFFNAHDALENDILRQEKEQIQLQVSAMISQMQPHFLYNTLAVIAALCEENPKLAAEATNTFSKYLRENMDFADKRNPIAFSEELNHIKTYVWLEKLRFPNKLNIEYKINCTDFSVPVLSIQPLVENAIKHGICKSRSGGTVRICSFETDLIYCITVSDDGVGFDVQKTVGDNKQHLGIKNTQYRIREMMGGSLDINSVSGKGTIVTIKIPKNKPLIRNVQTCLQEKA